jgi:hypothetical protein
MEPKTLFALFVFMLYISAIFHAYMIELLNLFYLPKKKGREDMHQTKKPENIGGKTGTTSTLATSSPVSSPTSISHSQVIMSVNIIFLLYKFSMKLCISHKKEKIIQINYLHKLFFPLSLRSSVLAVPFGNQVATTFCCVRGCGEHDNRAGIVIEPLSILSV